MNEPKNKYGIPIAKRIGSIKPKFGVSDGGIDEKTVESAKKAIAQHQAVIKALAKR